MKVINKQFKISKIEDISTDYILSSLGEQNIIRWAIVGITDQFYIIDGAVLIP